MKQNRDSYGAGSKKLRSLRIRCGICELGSSSGHTTAERLGQLAGLEIKGTPSKSEYEDKYYDFMVNGKKCELTAGKLLGTYNSLKLYCP